MIVAVVDSGCKLDHPDLVNRLVAGASFVDGFTTPTDDAGHGTRVAGIIAAQGNNSGTNKTVAGVAWDANVKVMPLKFMKKTAHPPRATSVTPSRPSTMRSTTAPA